MPWKDSLVKEQRQRFVEEHGLGLRSMSELCAFHGISRETGYKWIARFVAEGLPGLSDRSRAPHCQAQAMSAATEEALLAVRRKYPTWGPGKVKSHLERTVPSRPWPAQSTIGELFQRHGLTVPRKKRRRSEPASQPFGDCAAPNDTWCVDFKGWFAVGDGTRCDPLTLSDAYSRYLLRCQIVAASNGACVKPLMEAAFREYGLPRAIRSDNGPPFASLAPAGLSVLSIWWMKLGITPERIQPGKPQENGRHERFHRTLKQECAQPPSHTLRAQQRSFDAFRAVYNHERPHEALGQRPPAQWYQYSPRPFPARLPQVVYPGHMLVRRVEKKGQIAWNGGRIFVSEALAQEPVGLEPLDERYYQLYFMHLPLALVDTRKLTIIRGEQAKKIQEKINPRSALEVNEENR